MNQAKVNHVVSKLKFQIPNKATNLKPNPAGRVLKIQKSLTALLKYERLEMFYIRANEVRGYADRLISEAIRYGPTHAETMELADFWILEKQYIHKLFKVLVPRFENYSTSYTILHKIQRDFPTGKMARDKAVLELRGNPYPKIEYPHQFERKLLHNILLDEARKEFRLQKYKELSENLVKEVD